MIELLVVVAICAVILMGAVINISSGLAAARVRTATRGVVQLSRYARTMALLKQRSATVSYGEDGTIAVTLAAAAGGDKTAAEIGPLAAPVSIPKDAPAEVAKSFEDSALDETNAPASGPEELVDESAARTFEDISFHVEILGEDGEPSPVQHETFHDVREHATLHSVTDHATLHGVGGDGDDESTNAPATSVTYETNGRCPAYRVTVGRTGDGATAGLVVNVDRFGKVTVEDAD